jgi:hypothetical protein
VGSRALLGLFFDLEEWGHVPPKRPLTFNGLHGVIYQKIELFNLHIVTRCLKAGILKAGISEAALFNRQRTSVYPTTQLGESISVATELLSA